MGAQGGLGLEMAKLNRAPDGKGPAVEGKGEAEGKELSPRQRCLHVPVLSPFWHAAPVPPRPLRVATAAPAPCSRALVSPRCVLGNGQRTTGL